MAKVLNKKIQEKQVIRKGSKADVPTLDGEELKASLEEKLGISLEWGDYSWEAKGEFAGCVVVFNFVESDTGNSYELSYYKEGSIHDRSVWTGDTVEEFEKDSDLLISELGEYNEVSGGSVEDDFASEEAPVEDEGAEDDLGDDEDFADDALDFGESTKNARNRLKESLKNRNKRLAESEEKHRDVLTVEFNKYFTLALLENEAVLDNLINQVVANIISEWSPADVEEAGGEEGLVNLLHKWVENWMPFAIEDTDFYTTINESEEGGCEEGECDGDCDETLEEGSIAKKFYLKMTDAEGNWQIVNDKGTLEAVTKDVNPYEFNSVKEASEKEGSIFNRVLAVARRKGRQLRLVSGKNETEWDINLKTLERTVAA